ncbi:MAG: cytochrome c [Deltaproteobacteria bacterium]|nr:cytochrome c [Deltaproteobacteria bacterium]
MGCEEGDYLGGVERGIRAGVNGWDMWDGDYVRPYEDPAPPRVEGTVPREDRFSIEAGRAELQAIGADARRERAALTYRRYCHHCHGPNGDGRIIVGESLELAPADLRSPEVQGMSEQALFEHVQSGGSLMIPLGATMSPGEMLRSIDHLRTLEGRDSRPHFRPRNTEPIE